MDEALGTALSLRLADETGGRLYAETFWLPLEVVGRVGRSMIMARRQVDGVLLVIATESAPAP